MQERAHGGRVGVGAGSGLCNLDAQRVALGDCLDGHRPPVGSAAPTDTNGAAGASAAPSRVPATTVAPGRAQAPPPALQAGGGLPGAHARRKRVRRHQALGHKPPHVGAAVTVPARERHRLNRGGRSRPFRPWRRPRP